MYMYHETIFHSISEKMDSLSAEGLWNESNQDNISLVLTALTNSTPSQLGPQKKVLPIGFLSIYFILRIIWSILSIGGNSLTIYSVAKFKSLRSSTNYLVASLAMSDFVLGLQTPAVIVHNMFVDHHSFIQICLIEKTFTTIGIRGNYINTLWIAIDRFFYIVYPFRYPLWMTISKVLILIVLTWFYLLIETPLLMYFESVLNQGGICSLALVLSPRVYNGYIVPQLLACILGTILCYIAIAIVAYKQSMAIAALQQPFETLESSTVQRQKKIAKMMFMVLATYLLSYLPSVAMSAINQKGTSLVTRGIEKVTTLIFLMSTFINPFIYAWKSKEFNKAFKKILGLKNTIAQTYGNPLPAH